MLSPLGEALARPVAVGVSAGLPAPRHYNLRRSKCEARGNPSAGRAWPCETLFFELAIQDLTQAADLFGPIHERTNRVDGWVSLEVSPLLAYDSQKSSDEAKALHAKPNRRNLFIKIPGTREGLPAIEETIASGVPVNVKLLFSREQYDAAAEAYLKGLERRFSAGLSLDVHSVASIFVSRWDNATMDKVPGNLRDKLGIAISQQAYKSYRDLLETDRWQRLAAHGGASTASALCEHRHQGSTGLRCALYRCARSSQHRQYHARRNASRL
jgi:transaldolase